MTTLLATKATKQLTAAYKTAQKVSNRNALPILTHFHLYTDNGWLIVESTNLESATRETIPCRVENEFDICIPARAFKDWMSVIAKNYKTPIKIWVDTKFNYLYAEINEDGARSRTRFSGIDSAEFPPVHNLLHATITA